MEVAASQHPVVNVLDAVNLNHRIWPGHLDLLSHHASASVGATLEVVAIDVVSVPGSIWLDVLLNANVRWWHPHERCRDAGDLSERL